jgi:hypothetical protein
MPFSPFPAEDCLIWRGTKNGIFSIRSAYFLEMEKLANQLGSSSSSEKGTNWKECWNLNVHNVIKHFFFYGKHSTIFSRQGLILPKKEFSGTLRVPSMGLRRKQCCISFRAIPLLGMCGEGVQ